MQIMLLTICLLILTHLKASTTLFAGSLTDCEYSTSIVAECTIQLSFSHHLFRCPGLTVDIGATQPLTAAACLWQGYGLTETCGASFIALPRSGHSGTVGPPVASLEMRFEGQEELGYDPLGQPPRGELLIRGPALFAGYYKDAEKTKESIGEHLHAKDRLLLSAQFLEIASQQPPRKIAMLYHCGACRYLACQTPPRMVLWTISAHP